MTKSPRKCSVSVPVDLDDETIWVSTTAMVTPFRTATLYDPSCGWTVDILSMEREDGAPIDDGLWCLVEKTVHADPTEFVDTWIDANDRDEDDAAEMRREECRP